MVKFPVFCIINVSFFQNSMNYQHSFMLYTFEPFIRCNMSKYDAVYFVGDNEAINRVRVDSSKTRNRGALIGLLAVLLSCNIWHSSTTFQDYNPIPNITKGVKF